MKSILDELNENNGSNYKLDVLRTYKDNELLQRVLKMAYDKVTFTYGVTMKNISYEFNVDSISLQSALDTLESDFCTRNVTGNAALEQLSTLLSNMNPDDAYVLERIIERDLKINMGRTNINKVFKNLIVKPPYMRCGVYSKKTAKKITFPAKCQIKADGRYVAISVDDAAVTFSSRSGEEQEFPLLESIFKDMRDGVYIGELLVRNLTQRSQGNGLINSDNPPHDDIYVQLWDVLSHEEYADGKHTNKDIVRRSYIERFLMLETDLIDIDTHFVQLIPTVSVNTLQEALEQTSKWMNDGYEGSILKDIRNIFKDHTSPTQLKLKVELSLEVRVTGFAEGKKGTKREKTFGAMIFENDEGTIKGQTSGFTDKQLKDFNSRRDELIGKVITVVCNDITKGKSNNYYALSHPRFECFRDDKDSTDTLERANELLDMAKTLSKQE